MRIAHVTHFKEPAIFPFFRICLKLVEDWRVRDADDEACVVLHPYLRYLRSFVFLGLF